MNIIPSGKELKSERREKKLKKLKNKQIKHGYGNIGRDNLKKQLEGASRSLRKLISSKTKVRFKKK